MYDNVMRELSLNFVTAEKKREIEIEIKTNKEFSIVNFLVYNLLLFSLRPLAATEILNWSFCLSRYFQKFCSLLAFFVTTVAGKTFFLNSSI